MKKIVFSKFTGAGNDFVLIDKKLNPAFKDSKETISKLSNRRFGIGADGVLLIDDENGYDFRMHYYNADGNPGSLCGNGARCAIKYSEISGRAETKNVKFLCGGVSYSGELIDNDIVKFNLLPPSEIKLGMELKVAGRKINASFADTGSPHVVIDITDIPKNADTVYWSIEELPVYELGKEIRYSEYFAPGGANVNFVYIKDGEVIIRTYERGVENETLACGTGSAAAAVILSKTKNLKPPVKLITKSGETLSIDFSTEDNEIKSLSLTGPAKEVFKGEINL